ncbi:hypothetical protein D3C71_2032480 [compost metagenome]
MRDTGAWSGNVAYIIAEAIKAIGTPSQNISRQPKCWPTNPDNVRENSIPERTPAITIPIVDPRFSGAASEAA